MLKTDSLRRKFGQIIKPGNRSIAGRDQFNRKDKQLLIHMLGTDQCPSLYFDPRYSAVKDDGNRLKSLSYACPYYPAKPLKCYGAQKEATTVSPSEVQYQWEGEGFHHRIPDVHSLP
ncbi:hypothetical protein GOBAR_AA24139 [Gossypium barbadense]|uniref:Uncharacterized protein n=1 Tax=Gossypium barbadense TaxID=3634 RepID=A0A2P5WZL4_GOSBA|nr:hypothetical protein GOBAR_AA24139 [Gossypium barbadense]